jgi:iron(III) transport system substrate-binding protein
VRQVTAIASTLAALVLVGCGGTEPAADTDTLVLFSAHSEEIIAEFTSAFQTWYKQRTGRNVDMTWPDPGGGGTRVLKRLEDKFRAGRYDVDVVFGGGMIFQPMKQLGMLEAYRLPDEVLSAVPKQVAGQPLYDRQFHWYGAAVSTFGLIYNKTVLEDKGLPPVEDWETMADPRFFGLVGAGDPSKSASVRKAYDIILQAYGYEKGMSILVRMGGNAREFSGMSSEIPRGCAKGFLAVGPCIDFYAYRQMRSEGGDRLGFVAPPGLTVVNCDPIAILKKAPHRKVAEAFVEFVLTPPGQRLWMLPAGTEGGPKTYTLNRLAILPSVHKEAAAKGSDVPFKPFTAPAADFYDAEVEDTLQTVLGDYLRVAMVENHALLAKAWKRLVDAGLPADGVGELTRPLVSGDEMLRLGREVWRPVLIPDDASADERARLTRKEEQRQRTKSDIETAWSKAFTARYKALAE